MAHYASVPGLFPMQGGCPCGETRFQLQLPPILVHCCHCTACQRQQGTAFALNAVVESHNLVLLPPISPPTICSPNSSSSMPTSASPAVADLVKAAFPPNLRQDTDKSAEPTKPEIITVPSSSGVGQHIARCPSCHAGVWSYYADAGPHMAYVCVGSLDRASEVDPDVHIYAKAQRRSIFTISDGKPQFEGYYPDRAALCREDSKERLKAMESKIKDWKASMLSALGA